MYIMIEKNNGCFNGFKEIRDNSFEVIPNFTSFEKSCSNLGSGRFILHGFIMMRDFQEIRKQANDWENDILRTSGIKLSLTVVPIVWLETNWGRWKKNFPDSDIEKE